MDEFSVLVDWLRTPRFLIKSFFTLFFLTLFPTSLLLNYSLEVISKVRLGFLLSKSGYMSRAQRVETKV